MIPVEALGSGGALGCALNRHVELKLRAPIVWVLHGLRNPQKDYITNWFFLVMASRRSRFPALAERESGWDLSGLNSAKLGPYNALFDPNMRHFFENRVLQKHLQNTGQIDKDGRVIDLELNKSKMAIIEQEFKAAEKVEAWRQKEEEEMRYRVQQKRHAALERARAQERLAKIKEDRLIGREIIRATRESFGLTEPVGRGKVKGSGTRRKP